MSDDEVTHLEEYLRQRKAERAGATGSPPPQPRQTTTITPAVYARLVALRLGAIIVTFAVESAVVLLLWNTAVVGAVHSFGGVAHDISLSTAVAIAAVSVILYQARRR